MIDLHIHLGGAVPASVLWEILCDGGLDTEFRTFDQLQQFLTVNEGDIENLDDFLRLYFHATELIQSSPQAAAAAAYQAVAKAYRRAKITGVEVRYNPLKRTREGLHTMDSIILGTIQGLQKASMHYQVRTGIIFSMGKELKLSENWEIVQAAIRFHNSGVLSGAYGVVGIDVAGPESLRREFDKEWMAEVSKMVDEAKKAGLGVTWHIGETDKSGPEGMINVIEAIRPDRIGHGVQVRNAKGATKDKLLGLLKETNILLEICPSVNVVTRSVESYKDVADVVNLLEAHELPYCINTDNPYIISTNLQKEYDLMTQEMGNGFPLRERSHTYLEEATFLKTS